ncbi:cysteine-rich and transmembrane domain-containing protein B-like isoform X2 [Fagus crenata]
MSQYSQPQVPVAYPPPPLSYPPPVQQAGYQQGPFVAPPPVGYPMKNGPGYPQEPPSPVSHAKSKHRGDGFWKGCCAALCCCCVLDMCF